MGVPFEFPVSDIIAGIGVIKASIEAFSHTRGATKDDPIQDAGQIEVIWRTVR